MQNKIEVKKGKWIDHSDDNNLYECSVCGEMYILLEGTPKDNKYHYCPNCGSKML